MRWKPIETAPKNEEVDVWVSGTNGVGYRVPDAFWNGSNWVCEFEGMDVPVASKNFEATHWMPLPYPPIKASE